MKHLRLIAAILLAFGLLTATAAAAQTSGSPAGVEVVPERLCGVTDDSALRAEAFLTAAGHWSHEDWIANEAAQENVNRIHQALGALPRAIRQDENVSPEEEPLESRLSNGVLGVTLDNVTQRFIVVVDPDVVGMDAVASVLSDIGGDPTVQIRPGCHTIRELSRAESVLRSQQWHPGASEATYGFYMDPATAQFNVTFSVEDRAAADALAASLGELVAIDFGEPSRRSRLNDGEPHYGGAGIGTYNNNFCTSGFTIVKGGADGSATAGHCYSNGTSVYSGTQYYGYTTGKATFPTYDMIRIASSIETYSNKIHVDPCCPSVRTVVSDGDTAVNNYICASGMTTRAVCGVRMISMSGTLCDGGCTPNLGVAEDPNGRTVGQGGDSGAPIYNRWSNSRAAIRGMEIGGTAPDNIYFHKISRMESILGMSVAHS